MPDRRSDLDVLCRAAVRCRVCFTRLPIQAPLVDLAQPRWVGSSYWSAGRRIVIMLVNPGSGTLYNEASDRTLLEILRRYEKGAATLQEVFEHQGRDLANWGRGRFVAFHFDGIGLKRDEIALANIAWCATAGNEYPSRMLTECFNRHTRQLLDILLPDVVLLSGARTDFFKAAIRAALPGVIVISTFHYANRRSRSENQKEILRVRSILGLDPGGISRRTGGEETRWPTISRRSESRASASGDLTPIKTRATIDALVRLGFTDREFSLIHHMSGESLRSHSTYLAKSRTNAYQADSRNRVVARRLDWVREQAEDPTELRNCELWTRLAEEARERFPFA